MVDTSRPYSRAGNLLGCAVNFSEGRDVRRIEDIVSAASARAAVLDVAPDPDHHRTVATLGGTREELVDGVLDLAAEAVECIDLRHERGVHPHLGAVDVVPFYPVYDTPMAKAIEAAAKCARRLCTELAIPCFLYEHSSRAPGRTLPSIRRSAFAELEPDCGPSTPHPTAGASVVGARGLLVAYNVMLDTADPTVARKIAADLRTSPTMLAGIRTLGLSLASRNLAQVSVNIVDPARISLAEVLEQVRALARQHRVRVVSSELVGLVPRSCLAGASQKVLALTTEPHVLEEAFAHLY